MIGYNHDSDETHIFFIMIKMKLPVWSLPHKNKLVSLFFPLKSSGLEKKK